jgi:hypothetical protein
VLFVFPAFGMLAVHDPRGLFERRDHDPRAATLDSGVATLACDSTQPGGLNPGVCKRDETRTAEA